MNVVSARAAALRILAARRQNDAPVRTSYTLPEYQSEAVARALTLMQRRGGAIIADDVGLGKTYMAAALIEHTLSAGGSVLVAIPAVLRPTWRSALRPLDRTRIRLVTHTQLSRGLAPEPAALVVVDEAHGFRNPATSRYRHLRRLCHTSRVLLLTATPINNSLLDLYFQIRLFAGDHAFQDIGIGSLRALLGSAEPDSSALARLRREVIIRRTRDEVTGQGSFPAHVQLHKVLHDPVLPLSTITQLVDGLDLGIYAEEAVRLLVKLSLLKRFQSSRAAGLRSLDRLIGLHQQALAALAEGRLLRPGAAALDSDQLAMFEILLPSLPANVGADHHKAMLDRDLAVLRDVRERVSPGSDNKLRQLIELLRTRPPPARTIVFTEFRDTAEMLWRELRSFQVALVTSEAAFLGEHQVPREDAIRRFAPRANGAPQPGPAEAVYVLVATDVLAEGLNLQDASAVVSFDLPWNPVRLIQRAGRIDRLGSPHERIDVYNFIPDRDLDAVLRIIKRLRTKLHALRVTLRQHRAVLEPGESIDPETKFAGVLAAAESKNWDVDLTQAGPPGSVGATSPTAGRILLSFQRHGTVRELIIEAGEIRPAPLELADAIVERALNAAEPIDHESIAAAVAAAQHYLATESVNAATDPRTAALSRAIRKAITRLGFLAPPDLVSLADRALEMLSGYLGSAGAHVSQLRAANSALEVQNILENVIAECTLGEARKEEPWQLVAAVAAD